MTINITERTLYKDNFEYKLTPKEMKLLLFMSDNKLHTHEEIQKYMNRTYSVIGTTVHNIFNKTGVYIKNISKVGYILKKELLIRR